jgi:hypothetical protein
VSPPAARIPLPVSATIRRQSQKCGSRGGRSLLTGERSPPGAATTHEENVTNTTSQTASTRRRITAATLLVAAGAITGAVLGTAPANAADSWVAIGFSTGSGASGYANNQATQNGATQGALNMCRFPPTRLPPAARW